MLVTEFNLSIEVVAPTREQAIEVAQKSGALNIKSRKNNGRESYAAWGRVFQDAPSVPDEWEYLFTPVLRSNAEFGQPGSSSSSTAVNYLSGGVTVKYHTYSMVWTRRSHDR